MKHKTYIISILIILLLMLSIVPVFASNSEAYYSSAEKLAGKNIGVVAGTIFDDYARKNIDDCNVMYYNSSTDLAIALDSGLIDAYITDEPIAQLLLSSHNKQTIIEQIEDSDYAFCFPKSNDRASEKLLNELNAFLTESKRNGFLDYLKNKWIGKYEDIQYVDFSDLRTGENGVLKFGTSTDTGAPFSYMKDGAYAGYEIDLVVEFCKAYGYGLEISNYNFSGLLLAVQTGSVDFGAACVTITPEREQLINFTDPNYSGGIVIIGMKAEDTNTVSLDDLKGSAIGIFNGSVYDETARDNIEDCVLSYYNSFSDLATATINGNIDGFITDEPVAKYIISSYPSLKIVAKLTEDTYGMIFKMNDDKGSELCRKMNNFLMKCDDNGFLRKLESKWLYGDEESRTLDYSDLEQPGVNGTLVFGCCTDVGAPFAYVKDGKIVGYEIELAVEFCREYGYGIEIKNYAWSGMMNAVSSGIADFGGSCIVMTEERSEQMLFADPYYYGGQVLVMLGGEGDKDSKGFFNSIFSSFNRTFIRENRWQMFVDGISKTMVITLSSIIAGIILGFVLFLACKNGGKVINKITQSCFAIIQRTPVIVLLLILYYVVFGKILPDGIAVSIICFSLTFAASFFGIVSAGVGAIDKGQYEAAYVLGFNRTETFIHVILPQAAQHFLPLLKSEVITHIKATAVVGYIAVSDLTRVSDIIRSRTYEAFFPLIATAIIYYVLEEILVYLVGRIELKTNLTERTPEQILKGVIEK